MKLSLKNHPRRPVIAMGLIALLWLVASCTPPPPTPGGSSAQVIATMDPVIIANLTALPDAPPLSGEAAEAVRLIEEAVADCPDFSPERRTQVQQHIQWLYQPATIPPDIIMALGTNLTGRLIYGMAIFTSTEWRLQERPDPSCLLTIGLQLNELLVANNEPALTIYEATPAP